MYYLILYLPNRKQRRFEISNQSRNGAIAEAARIGRDWPTHINKAVLVNKKTRTRKEVNPWFN